MTDEKNDVQTNANPEYVGPPKAHGFKDNNTPLSIPPESGRPEIKLPPPPPINVGEIDINDIDESTLEIDEDSILMKKEDFKGDGGSNELLRAIAAGDNMSKEDKKKKKKDQKKDIDFKIYIEKAKELWEKRKLIKIFCDKHAKALHILNIIWMVLKTSFYIVGLAFFVSSFLFYLSFESLVRSYMDKKGLENITYERIEHSLSNFALYNIKEKNGLFTIDRIKAQYNFGELLKKKIPVVDVDSLKIHIQENEGSKNTTQALAKILLNLGVFEKNSLFSINSLNLSHSVLYIGNEEYKLPVNFYGGGNNLEKAKRFSFPITLKNEYLDITADVGIDLSASSSTWKIEILKGALTLPDFEPQDIKGTVTLTMAGGEISSINFSGQLKDNEKTKDVTLYFSKSGEFWSMRGTLSLPQRLTTTVYSVNLSNLVLDKGWKSVKSEAPLSIKITNFQLSNFKSEEIKLSLKGLLNCTEEGCSYHIKEKSNLTLFSPSYKFYESEFSDVFPIYIELLPSNEPCLVLNKKGIRFSINSVPNAFTLHRKTSAVTEQTVDVSLIRTNVRGSVDFEDNAFKADVLSDFKEINDTNFFLANGTINMSLKDEGLTTQVSAGRAQLKAFDYFKPEVSLNLKFLPGYDFKATIKGEKNHLSLNINGYYNPYSLDVLMAVQTTQPIVFAPGHPLPHEISSLFTDRLEEVMGNISLKGQIHYKGPRSVSGPLKVLIDDFSFKYGNTTVNELNGVLNLSQIVPFGAQGVQNIFIGSVNNVLPFTNVNAQVFFDAGRRQFNFSSLSAKVAGYTLLIDPMWYNYTSPIYTFNFKGRSVPAQNILNGTKLDDVHVKGNAQVGLTLQLEDSIVSLKSFELSIPSDGSIYYTPKAYPHAYLENLKNLDFRNMAVYISEQDKENELIFSSENKTNKTRKKTNFRMKIEKPLGEYILPQKIIIPDSILEEKESF